MIKKISVSCLLLASGAAFAAVDNLSLPESVRVPAGQMVKLETHAIGEITYECREKSDAPGGHAWAFAGPVATLYDAQKKVFGKYYGGPTWEAADGSRVTGKQVAVAPSNAPKSIPLQLVKAEPAMGNGAMTGVTYIQRLNTKDGVAPSVACTVANKGTKQQVSYEASYVFYARN
jgi:hypothetical protein